MNPIVETFAKQLAQKINKAINIPFLNEEQERIFFELVVTNIFEIIMGYILTHLEKKEAE